MFILISIMMLSVFIYSCCKIASMSDEYINKDEEKKDEENN